jgi:hypothetical protein
MKLYKYLLDGLMNMGAAKTLSHEGLPENLCELRFSKRGLVGSSCCLLHVGFMVGLYFDHDDTSDMFLRNFRSLRVDCTALHPRI